MNKLASQDVATVRTYWRSGWMPRDLARMFGVSEREIYNAIRTEPTDDGTGPDDKTLDGIFGPLRTPTSSPDERGDVGTSQKSNGAANA